MENGEIMETENATTAAPQAVAIAQPQAPVVAGFDTAEGFGLLQRMANMFSNSTLVPEAYRTQRDKDGRALNYNGISNCVIALNMAQRMHADPLMVIQNLYIVHGQPAWSSKFMIATFNKSGRYTSIRYKETGKKGTDSQGVIAYATELATGELLEGPEVTIAIAKAEKWFDKTGSKWKTMPDQMLRYRAAAWFIRTTAPELSMGLQTYDEVKDVHGEVDAESIYERPISKPKEAPKEEPVTIEAEAVETTPSDNTPNSPQEATGALFEGEGISTYEGRI